MKNNYAKYFEKMFNRSVNNAKAIFRGYGDEFLNGSEWIISVINKKTDIINEFYIGKGFLLSMIPLPYNPREKNIIQTIFEENYADFENIYDEVYAKDYGIYRLDVNVKPLLMMR